MDPSGFNDWHEVYAFACLHNCLQPVSPIIILICYCYKLQPKVHLSTMMEAGLAGIMPDYTRQVWIARLAFPGQDALSSPYNAPDHEVRFYIDAQAEGQTWLKAFQLAHKWFWMKQFLLSKITKAASYRNQQIPGCIPQHIIDLHARLSPVRCYACDPPLPELTVTELQFLAVLKNCIQEDDEGCGDKITLPVCGAGLQLGGFLRQAATGVGPLSIRQCSHVMSMTFAMVASPAIMSSLFDTHNTILAH